ncbi:glycosyltransferase [Streptomyces antibioticus]|uniref:glycosyltransferase n=1 Tax=Streptomyces antibioticus TaxID=1890 RepID=UPI0033DC1D7E
MIVKDEAPVIRRCLESVRPLIDTWVILDTGSTDGTQDIVREVYGDLPGKLHESDWKGYDRSRTEAIDLARDKADYLLFMDADDMMETEPGFRMPPLTHDAYRVALRHGPMVHWRPALVSTRLPWRYVGVLHEYIECGQRFSLGTLEGANIRTLSGGARLQKEGQRQKYLRDAATLQKALVDEPQNSRHVFYLAQSWRDAGELEKAMAAYDRRTVMGGFAEEVFCAHLNAARLAARLERPQAEVIDRFLRAHESRPSRAEALGELARLCRQQKRWSLAYLFAGQAARISQPKDILFVEFGWYEWQALDELGISAYWVGNYEESARCSERLLKEGRPPAEQRDRIERNLAFARDKLRVKELVMASVSAPSGRTQQRGSKSAIRHGSP